MGAMAPLRRLAATLLTVFATLAVLGGVSTAPASGSSFGTSLAAKHHGNLKDGPVYAGYYFKLPIGTHVSVDGDPASCAHSASHESVDISKPDQEVVVSFVAESGGAFCWRIASKAHLYVSVSGYRTSIDTYFGQEYAGDDYDVSCGEASDEGLYCFRSAQNKLVIGTCGSGGC
jgi:hypothetical protein